jgi:cation:H+ antiporter
LAIKAVERLSRSMKISSFMVSFLILGFFTSISEFSVGINSVIENDPEIYVGNLIGASIVLFLLIVPLLAIVGKSIHITPEFRGFNLPASLVVIALPVILALDGMISRIDSIIAIVVFGLLLISLQAKKGLFEHIKDLNVNSSVTVGKEILRIIFGIVIIFVSSRFVVEQTLYFSEILKVSPFLMSLLIIAVGTNIPELSLVARSIFMRNHQVAFGDYVGSASVNTFLLGLLTLIYDKPVYLTNSYVISLLFLIVGLLIFYYFARTKNTISRIEGLVLLLIYGLFIYTEMSLHKSLMFWVTN